MNTHLPSPGYIPEDRLELVHGDPGTQTGDNWIHLALWSGCSTFYRFSLVHLIEGRTERPIDIGDSMKAIAFTRPLPIEAPDSLVELDLPRPEPGPHDLLVNVRAVSVNPVDTKVRGARHQGSASDATGSRACLAGMRRVSS
jgi:hypothetical protein